MIKPVTSKLQDWQWRIWLALLALMPFHAWLTTWLGSSLGARPIWQAWKEVLIIVLLGILVYGLTKYPLLREFIFDWWPNKLVVLYIFLHLILIVAMRPPAEAALFSLKTNLEFLILFVSLQLLAWRRSQTKKQVQMIKIILLTGLGVALFGTLQALLLPADFLTHFGYGASTIEPFLLIQDSQQVRILSTLGGPNQLGQYLLIPIGVALVYWLKNKQFWWLILPGVGLALISLYRTFSRSAWLGLVGLLVVLLLLQLPLKRALVVGSVLFMGLFLGLVLILTKIESLPSLSFLVFHSPVEKALKQSSDSDRIEAVVESSQAVIEQPTGFGPGTAGPASFRSNQALVTENYYLQLAYEVGIIGLGIFLAICGAIIRRLYQMRHRSQLVRPLLASFIAISFINLFLHGWTDSTTALIWWGTAGIVLRQA